MDPEANKRQNEEAVRAAEMAGAAEVPAWPIKFNLELTAECNLHCFMCPCEEHRNRMRAQGVHRFSMPVETFRKVADRIFPTCRVFNPTVVGEPLVLPYLDELIERCREHAVLLDIYTNGTLLDERRARALLPVLHALTISFDGAEPATFERIRTGARFATVMRNLEVFARLREEMGPQAPPLRFSVTLMRSNIEELPRIMEIAAAHGVGTVMTGHMVACTEALQHESLINHPELTRTWLDRARKRADALGLTAVLPRHLPSPAGADPAGPPPKPSPSASQDIPETPPCETAAPPAADIARPTTPPETPAAPGLPPEPAALAETEVLDPPPPETRVPERWQGRIYCGFPWREVFIAAGGELSPCCAPGRPVIGNAFAEEFMELWNGPEYRRLRRGLYTGKPTDYCARCPFMQQVGYQEYRSDSYR